MKRISIVLLILFALFLTSATHSFAQLTTPAKARETTPTVYHQDITIYWVDTSNTVTVAWDPSVGGATGYEIEVRWIVGNTIRQVYTIGDTVGTEISFRLPRAGAFVAAIRAYNFDLVDPTKKLYSEWARSNDPTCAIVDGLPKGWILIASLAAPGPIIP